MNEIHRREEMEKLIAEEPFALFYLSRPSCGVCTALKPKIIQAGEKIPGLSLYYIDLDGDASIAGQFSVFTIPAILVYAQGRETIREARYISVGDIESRLLRLAELMS